MQATLTMPSEQNGGVRESHHNTVLHLQRSVIFRDYQSAFETTTGLPLALRSAGSMQPPLHGSKQANAFCTLMATQNKSCAACLQLQQRIKDSASVEPRTLECFAGLNESAVPIRLGETVVGYLQTGQVLLRKPSKVRFKDTARRLREWEAKIDLRQLETAYYQTRVLTKRQYDAVLRLLAIFAQQLSALSNQLMVQETEVDPPVVVKVRSYIMRYLDEKLTLPRLAQSMNMSPFHLCRTFKRATGLTFTEYLARMRIEKTKQLLLNPHTRISEVAFAVGFQSLSQFNRVFRRVAGEAPSSYRDRLPNVSGSSTGKTLFVHAA